MNPIESGTNPTVDPIPKTDEGDKIETERAKAWLEHLIVEGKVREGEKLEIAFKELKDWGLLRPYQYPSIRECFTENELEKFFDRTCETLSKEQRTALKDEWEKTYLGFFKEAKVLEAFERFLSQLEKENSDFNVEQKAFQKRLEVIERDFNISPEEIELVIGVFGSEMVSNISAREKVRSLIKRTDSYIREFVDKISQSVQQNLFGFNPKEEEEKIRALCRKAGVQDNFSHRHLIVLWDDTKHHPIKPQGLEPSLAIKKWQLKPIGEKAE